jgi:hypothetical protein
MKKRCRGNPRGVEWSVPLIGSIVFGSFIVFYLAASSALKSG